MKSYGILSFSQVGGRGIEQKGKRTHGRGQQCGDCWEVGVIRELNGDVKIHNKD